MPQPSFPIGAVLRITRDDLTLKPATPYGTHPLCRGDTVVVIEDMGLMYIPAYEAFPGLNPAGVLHVYGVRCDRLQGPHNVFFLHDQELEVVETSASPRLPACTPPQGAVMLCYLVTQGRYSDTAIVALFSDESLAQRLAAHLDHGQVIPLPLDVEANHVRLGLLPYLVWLNPDGNVDLCQPDLPDVSMHQLLDNEYYVWAASELEAAEIARARQRQEP